MRILISIILVIVANTAWAKVEQKPDWDTLTKEKAYELLKTGQYDPAKVSNGGDTALHNAVKKQDLHAVRLALFIGIEPAIANKAGDTALHIAAAKASLAIMQLLIENNAPLNWPNKAGDTPLHNAAARGDLALVKYLVERGTPLDAKNVSEQTPYHKALDKEDIAAYLVEQGYLPGDPELEMRTALGYSPTASPHKLLAQAIEKDDADFVKKLAATMQPYDFNFADPLLLATKKGNLRMVELLMELGAKVDWTAYYCRDLPRIHSLDHTTTLHEAAKSGKSLILALLLKDEHILLNARDDKGATALHYAVANGDIYAVKLLIERGADINGLSSSEYKKGSVPQDFWTEHDWVAMADADSALPHRFETRQQGWVHPIISPLSLALERAPHNQALLDLLQSHGAKEHYEPSSWEKGLRF